jgi:hypothetical protein
MIEWYFNGDTFRQRVRLSYLAVHRCHSYITKKLVVIVLQPQICDLCPARNNSHYRRTDPPKFIDAPGAYKELSVPVIDDNSELSSSSVNATEAVAGLAIHITRASS